MAGVDDERGGRYATEGSKQTVIGPSPIAYPAQPAGSPWRCDPCGTEPPLGIDINAQDPTGEAFEVAASSAQGAAAASDASADRGGVARKFVRRF
jgi:hypothetical protein